MSQIPLPLDWVIIKYLIHGPLSAFKFLPVIGKYISAAFQGNLPSDLLNKWKFPTQFRERFQGDAFAGDGSRGGPERRELTTNERDTFEVALKSSSRQSKI